MEHVITFNDDGTAGAIYHDDIAPILRELGPCQTVRASDVEPTENGEGWEVRFREWVPGGWVTLGPFPTRQAALAAEVAELRRVL